MTNSAEAERDNLERQVDAFWKFLEQGFEIEPREYFEAEIQKGIGFCDSPLVMALHHVWKRKPQVALLAQRIAELESANRLAINRLYAIERGQGEPEDSLAVVQALKKALWFEGRAGNEGNDNAD